MAFQYHVKTCGYLPNSKRTFDCYCKAMDYIKDQLAAAPKELDKEELEMSVTLLRLDSELDARVAGLFPSRALADKPYLQKVVK